MSAEAMVTLPTGGLSTSEQVSAHRCLYRLLNYNIIPPGEYAPWARTRFHHMEKHVPPADPNHVKMLAILEIIHLIM